jgi:hypothetical protein
MLRLLGAIRMPDQSRDWFMLGGQSPEDALRRLRSTGAANFIEVGIAGYGAGALYSDDDLLDGANVAIQLAFPLHAFLDRDPRAHQLFIDSWVGFCDAASPPYAYFGASPLWLSLRYRDQAARLLAGHKVPDLIREQSAWLSYFGPSVAPSWRGRLPRPTANEEYVWLPSGALFIRNHDPIAENHLEESPANHGYFLEKQLESHRDVPGVTLLLQVVRGDMQGFKDYREGLVRLAMEHGPLNWPPREPISIPRQPDYDADLDEIHTLWATASTRPGLRGVNQVYALRDAQGQETSVIVTVVAREGAEWIVPIEHAPATVDDDAWRLPGIGLRARVRDLLEAAGQHPVGGRAPVVVVVAWGGIAAPVRAALEAMGVAVEVPASAVPLIEN